jgi:hypothetical protein
MTNQYIHLPRLAMTFSKFWFENKRTLALLFGAIAAFLLILLSLYYSFNAPNLFREHFQVAYYFTGLFLSGILSASFLFSELRNKPRAIAYLMVPASQIEKFICVMFFGLLVFWSGYSIIFTCINYVFVSMNNARMGRTDEVINIFTINKYQNPFLEGPSLWLFFIYFAIHALFALGSIYFARYAFFKTLIVFLFFWLLFFFVPVVLHRLLPPGGWVSSLFKYEVYDDVGNFFLTLPEWFRILSSVFFSCAGTTMLWVATYFKLTERQIA